MTDTRTGATVVPTAGFVPIAGSDGTLDRGWVEGPAIAATHQPIGLSQTAIAANATTALLNFDPSAAGMAVLYYVLVRGTRKVAGLLLVLLDGTSPNVTNTATTAIGTTGVSFTATVTSGIVALNIVVDNADSVTVSITLVGQKLTYPA